MSLFRHRHRLLSGAVAIPVITGVTPSAGAVGDVVTITGINFGAARGVGGVVFTNPAAPFSNSVSVPNILSWSDTQIVARVPDGLAFPYANSFIRVTTNTAQGASSAATFLWSGGAGAFLGASLQFQAITDAAQTGLDPLTSDWAVSFWANVTALGVSQIFLGKGATISTAAGAIGWEIALNAAGSVAAIWGNSTSATRASLNSLATLTAGVWTHLTFNFARAGSVTIYVNGTSNNATAMTLPQSIDASADFTLGAASVNGGGRSSYFTGSLDGIGIWRRVLTAGEITSLYNAGQGINYASAQALGGTLLNNLAAWWDLDDAGGSGATWVDRLGANSLTAGTGTAAPTSVRGVR